MERRLRSTPAVAAIAALLLAGWLLASAHVPEPGHCRDTCAICHARSERAADTAAPAPLPAPALAPAPAPAPVLAAPRAAVLHPWAARAPPSADVVSA